ncbi:MAG: hypothetical protein BWK76_15390 [Desulfobulbaceae bacterium A2]|nr:MAG: hypothetical protein BWK76_15390 [Desulfobulbaceae bacterium A2]
MSDLRRSLFILLLGLFALAAALAVLVFALVVSQIHGARSAATAGSDVVQSLSWALPLLLALYAGCALWGYVVLTRRLVQPAERMLQRVETAGLMGLTGWFLDESSSGFSRLSHSLNELLGSLTQERDQLRQTVAQLEEANRRIESNRIEMARAERLASVGRLAAGMAHEIGNPLGIASGYLQLLQDEGTAPADRCEYIARAGRELERIDALIRRLLLCTRGGKAQGGWQEVSVSGLVRDLLDDLRHLPSFRGIELCEQDSAPRDILRCDPGQLRQVLLNCLLNAADALAALPEDASRRIVVATDCPVEGPARIEIVVSDSGSGIPPEHLPLVFDPFFTSKEPGRGTGLGLSVCDAIVGELGGSITIESPPGQGASVRISLPLANKELA